MLKQLWDYIFLVRLVSLGFAYRSSWICWWGLQKHMMEWTLDDYKTIDIDKKVSTRTSIDEWKTTPWVEIDVENMDMECKKFAKVILIKDTPLRNRVPRTCAVLTRICASGTPTSATVQ